MRNKHIWGLDKLNNFRKSISFKLLGAILALSLAATLIATGIRSYQSYQDHIHKLNEQMKYIEKSYIPGIITSLWEMDKEHIQIQLEGILRLPYMQYAAVISEDKKVIASAGSLDSADRISKRFDLSYIYSGQEVRLGYFEAIADINPIKTLIWKELYSTLLVEGLKILFLSLLILLIIHLLITRHLQAMAVYTRQLNIRKNYTPLVLYRRSSAGTNKDELDEVASALNDVLRNLKESFEQLTQNNLLLGKEIVEHKQAEEALRESEEKYRTVADFIYDWEYWIAPDGKIIYVSPSCERMSGYRVEDFQQDQNLLLRIVHPGDKYLLTSHLHDSLRGNSAVSELDFRIITRDNKEIWINHICQDVYSLTGDYLGRRASNRDITERKRAEEEKRSLEERLQRAEKMEALGQLAGGVAHDLNNVLGVLTGYSELLLAEIPEGSRPRTYVDKILQSTEKGAAIIQDLLTLARRGVTTSDVINLNSVVSGFLKTLVFEKVKDYHPRVKFITECDENLLNIKGSPLHLEKTLMNLVSNAAEAIPGKGEVVIRTQNRHLDTPVRGYDEVKEGDYVVLTVSDSGTGIAAENIGKIFEPFYSKKTMGRSGTGLGLAIVWGTIKDHHGYIDVRTEVGRGTVFMLYFPVTREEPIAPKQNEPIERYTGKGESVLVVDDIAEQRDVASRLLTRLGYDVHVASSGEEAVEYLKGHKADILVLDMIMAPGIDGLETFQRVLEINPQQKAILVSGFSETERVKKAQKIGAGAYVRKPYIMEKIGVAIRDELNR